MSYENYYEYVNDVDIDSQTLFDYVAQQSDVTKAITETVPAKPQIFGQAMEPFKSDTKNIQDEEKKVMEKNTTVVDKPKSCIYNVISYSHFKWMIFILLALLALYFLFRTKNTCNYNQSQYNVINEYTPDSATPIVGSEFRAIFAR